VAREGFRGAEAIFRRVLAEQKRERSA